MDDARRKPLAHAGITDMFDIITKQELWEWHDAGFVDRSRHDLKAVQDAFIISRLHDVSNARILEIGGGNSRVLAAFSDPARQNECWNADPFEGAGNGPTDNKNHESIRVVNCLLGDFRAELPDAYFDYLISVSVVEHVPTTELEMFFADSARVLRPGGRLIHAIDLYVYDHDQDAETVDGNRQRLRRYLQFAERRDLGLQFVDVPQIDEHVAFRGRYATNPDAAMHVWNSVAPRLRPVREIAQSVSIKAEWIKDGADQ